MSQLKNAFARFIESLESRTLLSNAAGTPDVTFGSDGTGYVLTDVGGGASYTVNDMGIDPAGRIIVVGDIITAAGSTTPNDIYVLAYTPNGSLDPTFGVGGKLIINLGSIDSARALLIQPDGKLIIGGFTKLPASNSEDLLVARLNSDGSFDNSFGAGGKTINDISGNDELYDLAFLPDGRFVGSGNAGNSTACHIVQYLANGQLDPSFGTGGIANANYFSDMATGIAVQPSGKILFAGRIYDSGFTYLLNVGRFNSDGTLDTSFKYHQKIDPITSALLTYIVALPDGKFMVSTQGALLRFNADGGHDLTFGSSGIVRGNSGTPIIPGDARGLVMDSAGKFIRVGYKAQFPIHDVAIVRHHPNGLTDPSFGNESGYQTGYDVIDLGGKPEQGYAVALQPDGQIVVAGLTTNGNQRLFVLRVDGSNPPNIPPVPKAGGPYQIREGGLIRLSGSATDSDGAIDHYEWDFNYDGVNFDVDATGNKSDFYDPLGQRPVFNAAGIDGPSTRTIAMRVFDSQYASVIDTTTLTITNSAPALLASGPPRIIPGQPYTITFSASPDPGQDTISSWQIDWGDGSALEVLPASATSGSHIFANSDHPYHITVSATDEDGTYMANRAALDPSYGAGAGFIINQHWWDTSSQAAALDPFTGKLYALGSSAPYIFRYNPDGTPDTTWGTNGVVQFDYNVTNESSQGINLQPDGSILVWMSYGELYVGHFDVFGRRDTTFGDGTGTLHGNYGQPFGDMLNKLVPLPDGKFIMAGSNPAFPNQLVLARYTSAGTIDTTFGTGGFVRTQAVPGINNAPLLIDRQTDGKILALLDAFAFNSSYVIRFNPDGTLDSTFGPDDTGYAAFQTTPPPRSGVLGITSQPDGKIIAWYNVQASILSPDYDIGLLRLTSDGALDSTFANAGHLSLDLSGVNDGIGRVMAAPDGGLFVSGSMFLQSPRALILKLTDAGALDPTFANGGLLTVQNTYSGISQLISKDDKLYLLGTSGNAMLNVRLNYGPILARANDPPAIPTITLDDSVNEGATYSIGGTISDPDVEDSHLLTINWGDGSDPSFVRLAPGVFSWSAQHVYQDDNPTATPSDLYTISLTADDRLDAVSTTRSVRVMNVAPIADLGSDRTGVEGDLFTFNPIRIDPGVADTFTYAWSASSSNGTLLSSSNATKFTFIPPDNGTYTIRLKLTDDDGGEWNDSLAVIAANAQPLVVLGATRTGTEGTAVSINPAVADDGSADILTYNWSIYKPDGSLGWTYSSTTLSFTPPDNGLYRVVLTVTDDDGGAGSDQTFIQALNAIPALSYVGNGGAFQNVPYQVSLSVTDPGADTISSWTINWGDGAPTETIQSSLGPLTHVYTTIAAGIRITGSATDEDGTYSIITKTINVVPATTLMADGTLLIGGTTQNDTLSISVNSVSNKLQATLNGAIVEYPLANVARFEASLGAGNDTVTFLTSGIPGGIVRGEDGNDTMTISAALSSPIQFLGGNTSAFLDVLNVNAGTYTFMSDPRVGTGRLGVYLNAATVVFDTTAHLDGLVLANASRATVAPNGSRYLRLVSLSIGGGSVVDLTNNDLIMQPPAANAASVASNIAFLLRQAYNAPTHWQDASLTSGSARANSSRALGFMRNLGPKYTTFDGETVDINSTLVAYTIVGDLNLDRRVTISDFIDLSANFGSTSSSWNTGDVNYDQKTSIADFIELSSNFGQTLSPPAPPAAPAMAATGLQLDNIDSMTAPDDSPRRKPRSSDALPPRGYHRPRHRRQAHHPAPRLSRRAD